MKTKSDVLYDAAIVNEDRGISVEWLAASIEFLSPSWIDAITTDDIRRYITATR